MNTDAMNSATPPPRSSGPGRSGTRRRLYRSDDDRIVSGVAGGIAEYFDVDPVIVRIAFVVLTLAGGAGFIGYIAAWVLLPEHDGSAAWMGNTPRIEGRRRPGRADARQLGAIALGPVALIGGGAAVLWGQRNREDAEPSGPDTPGAPGASARHGDGGSSDGPGGSGGPDDGGGPSGAGPVDSGGGVATMVAPSTELVVVRPDARSLVTPVDDAAPVCDASTTGWGGSWSEEARTGGDSGGGSEPPPPPPPDRRRDRRPSARARRRAGRAGRTPFARAALGLFIALAGAVLLAGRLGAFDNRADRHVDGALAVLLIALGAVLTLGAWLGRPRGFIFLGLLTGAVLIASSTIDVSWSGGFGNRTVSPTHATVQGTYRLTAGQLHLDLSDVDMRHQRVRIAGEVSLGRLLIEVPKDVKVVVDAKAAAGHTVLFGDEEGGTTQARQAIEPGASESDGTLAALSTSTLRSWRRSR